MAAAIPTVTTLEPGMVVGGDYVVGDRLSEGGMGAVYLATQRSTGVRRALKVMHPQLVSDERLRERFAREARVSATIPSDHVVNVLAAGVDDELGIPFLAMELLDGRSLDGVVKRHGPLGESLADGILRQVAHALAAAARMGIVHRDLKPENVFVSPARSVGLPFVVKVLDFGIAKLVAAARTSTQSMGTPLWFAPEQTDTRSHVTPATDVWPFGLLAFYLFTGEVFWEAARLEGAGIEAVLRELVLDAIPKASERARSVGRALPPWFDAWFERCVVREAGARFGDVGEAYAALRAARRAEGEQVAPAELARFMAAVGEGEVPAIAPSGRTMAAAPLEAAVAAAAPAYGPGGTEPGALAADLHARPTPQAPLAGGTLASTLPMDPEIVAQGRARASAAGAPPSPRPAPVRSDPGPPARSPLPYVVLGIVALLGVGGLAAGLSARKPAEEPATATGLVESDEGKGTSAIPLEPLGDGELETTDLKVGEGPPAKKGDRVETHYVGTFADGSEFDSSRARGQPFVFPLGAGRVIKGWDEGVVGMRAGGLRRLRVPPRLAYGSRGVPPKIPANATLIFEIELLRIE